MTAHPILVEAEEGKPQKMVAAGMVVLV